MAIGYIGLGNMGGALALRLLESQPLIVHDRNPKAAARLADAGAVLARSPADLARQTDIILMCLPKSADVQQVIFGPAGLAEAVMPGTLLVDQTTGDPEVTRQIAERLAANWVTLIDAPVSGGARAARAGTIAIMAGGSEQNMARARPVLQAISPNVFHVGDTGTGQVMKLANNLLHHSQRLLSLEIVALAARNGVDPKQAVDVLLSGSGRNYYLEHNMHPRILAGILDSGFTLDLLCKDVGLAVDLARRSGVPVPLAGLAHELYQSYRGQLGAHAEPNMIAQVVDRVSGTQIVPTKQDPRRLEANA